MENYVEFTPRSASDQNDDAVSVLDLRNVVLREGLPNMPANLLGALAERLDIGVQLLHCVFAAHDLRLAITHGRFELLARSACFEADPRGTTDEPVMVRSEGFSVSLCSRCLKRC